MDPDELLKMLDLNGKPTRVPDESLAITSPEATPPETTLPRSATALVIDEWGLGPTPGTTQDCSCDSTGKSSPSETRLEIARRASHEYSTSDSDLAQGFPEFRERWLSS